MKVRQGGGATNERAEANGFFTSSCTCEEKNSLWFVCLLLDQRGIGCETEIRTVVQSAEQMPLSRERSVLSCRKAFRTAVGYTTFDRPSSTRGPADAYQAGELSVQSALRPKSSCAAAILAYVARGNSIHDFVVSGVKGLRAGDSFVRPVFSDLLSPWRFAIAMAPSSPRGKTQTLFTLRIYCFRSTILTTAP